MVINSGSRACRAEGRRCRPDIFFLRLNPTAPTIPASHVQSFNQAKGVIFRPELHNSPGSRKPACDNGRRLSPPSPPPANKHEKKAKNMACRPATNMKQSSIMPQARPQAGIDEARLQARDKLPKAPPAYAAPAGSPLTVDKAAYTAFQQAPRVLIEEFTIPARSGRAWEAPAGSIIRISTPEGPQVGDLNIWNRHNPRERFWAGRTKQLHASHVSTDRKSVV